MELAIYGDIQSSYRLRCGQYDRQLATYIMSVAFLGHEAERNLSAATYSYRDTEKVWCVKSTSVSTPLQP